MRNLLLLFIPLLFSMCSNEITDKDEYEAQIIVTSNSPINAGIGSNTVLWNILSVIGSDSDGRLIMLSWNGSAETTNTNKSPKSHKTRTCNELAKTILRY